jgi:phosphatidylserine/phosphatidylglycerophosphate/cardiolipin synthase-like enzyme
MKASRCRAALSLLVAATLVVGPQAGSSRTAQAAEDYVPLSGPVFNDPYGRTYSPRAIEDHIEALIESSPKGSTIRVATLGIDAVTARRALVAAYRRGVIVRVVLPDAAAETPDVVKLRRVLGNRWWRPGSYLVTCNRGCYSDSPNATMHAKLYMFSQTGASGNVVVSSSANLTRRAMYHNWNDAYTFVDNQEVYAAARAYVDGMRFDVNRAVATPVVSSGRNQVLFYPEPNYRRTEDVYTTLLADTACSGARSASAVNGRTVVKVATSRWGARRLDVVRRLGNKVAAGCKVQVLVKAKTTDPRVLLELVRRNVPTRYSDGPDGLTANNHSKFLAVSGHIDRDRARSTVVTGSLNMTGANDRSDNVMVRIGDSARTYRRYADSFAPIYRQATPLTATVARAQARRSR